MEKEAVAELIGRAKEHLLSLSNVIEIDGRTLVIGDLHADMVSTTSAIRKFKRGDYDHILFLGDYVDRGKENMATVNTLFGLMLKEKDKAHMLRGNHEIKWVNTKHGLLHELEEMNMAELHNDLNDMFSKLPVAAIVGGKVFATHGGVPMELPTISEIQAQNRDFQDHDEDRDSLLLGLMWNDPNEVIDDFSPNEKRGRMYYFGKRALNNFLEKNGLESFVRGHERWIDGCKYLFDKKLLSLFSSKSYNRPIKTKAAIIDDGNIEVVPL